jgi:hypothetical protein
MTDSAPRLDSTSPRANDNLNREISSDNRRSHRRLRIYIENRPGQWTNVHGIRFIPRTELRWTPLQPTYPMPDRDSAHAVEGGAAAEALKQFFGTDRMHFSACSLSLPAGSTCSDATPVFRSFDSFSGKDVCEDPRG